MPFVLGGEAVKQIVNNIPGAAKYKKEKGVEGFKEGIKDTFAGYKMINEQIFSDARSKLERLKEAGNKFGEEATEAEKGS